MPIENIFLSLLVVVILGMDIKATNIVLSDALSEPKQKTAQLLFVWLLPILGAIVVFGVHRPKEKHPEMYREIPDSGDDFGFPRHNDRMGKNRAGDGGDDD